MDLVAYYNHYFVITRHYDKSSKSLKLTIIDLEKAFNQEFQHPKEKKEDDDEYYWRDEIDEFPSFF